MRTWRCVLYGVVVVSSNTVRCRRTQRKKHAHTPEEEPRRQLAPNREDGCAIALPPVGDASRTLQRVRTEDFDD